MGVLDINVKNAPVIEPIETDDLKEEYKLKVVRVNDDNVQADSPRLQVILEVPEEATAPDIYHTIWLPKADATEKENARTMSSIKRWLEVLDVPIGAKIDYDEWVGREFWATLKYNEETDKYGASNSIKKLLHRSIIL